ncbi:MAG: DUF4837 family protein [Bacteroidetes bacterium]|nr:DUF4837 family protein [Bacteroidota bacterium]
MKNKRVKNFLLSSAPNWGIALLILGMMISCNPKQAEKPEVFQDEEITKNAQLISEGIEYSIVVISDLVYAYPDLKSELNKLFAFEMPVLPQPESYFRLIFVHPDSISDLQKRNLCVMLINLTTFSDKMNDFARRELKIEADHKTSAHYQMIENAWAYPQEVIYIEGTSMEEMIELITSQQDEFVRTCDKTEKIRLKRRVYAKGRNNTATNRLLKMHHIDISIPKGFVNIKEIVPSGSDSILEKLEIDGLSWFRNNTKAYSMDLLFYYTSLDEYKNAAADQILMKKDKITSQLVQGHNPGSYVVIAYDYNPPQIKNTTVAGLEALEIRGLWETKEDFMGGPFLLYAVRDTKNNRMLFIDAFVYAPQMMKKPFIKRLEVSLETLR